MGCVPILAPGGGTAAEITENLLQAAGVVASWAEGKMTSKRMKGVDLALVICADGRRMAGVYKIPKQEYVDLSVPFVSITERRGAKIDLEPGGSTGPVYSTDKEIKSVVGND